MTLEQPPVDRTLWFEAALLPDGWARDVRAAADPSAVTFRPRRSLIDCSAESMARFRNASSVDTVIPNADFSSDRAT